MNWAFERICAAGGGRTNPPKDNIVGMRDIIDISSIISI